MENEELKKLEERRTEIDGKIHELNETDSRLSAERDALQAELDNLKQKGKMYSPEYAEYLRDVTRIGGQLSKDSKDISEYKKEIKKIDSRKVEIQEKKQEYKKLKETKAELEEKISKIKEIKNLKERYAMLGELAKMQDKGIGIENPEYREYFGDVIRINREYEEELYLLSKYESEISDIDKKMKDLEDELGKEFLNYEPEKEQPQPEQPQAEEPQPAQPQTEQPQTERPQTERPQTERPQTEQPQTTQPQTTPLTLDNLSLENIKFDISKGVISLSYKDGDMTLNDYNVHVVYDDRKGGLSEKQVRESIEGTELTEFSDPYIIYAINKSVEMLQAQNESEGKQAFETLRKRLIEKYQESVEANEIEEGKEYLNITYTKSDVEEVKMPIFGLIKIKSLGLERNFSSLMMKNVRAAEGSPNVTIDDSIDTRTIGEKFQDFLSKVRSKLPSLPEPAREREENESQDSEYEQEEEDFSTPVNEPPEPMPAEIENKLRNTVLRGMKYNMTEEQLMSVLHKTPEASKYADFDQIARSIIAEEMPRKQQAPEQDSQDRDDR